MSTQTTEIASFSGGRLSAIMVERLFVNGRKPLIVFMNTRIEDDDNYRFIGECEARWKKLYGTGIITLREGRTPYEVSRAEHVIPNSRVAPCTRRLKIEPFVNYVKSKDGPITIHIGYDFSEIHRCEATTKNYAKFGWWVDYPMLWKPLEFRDYGTVIREWGIEPPRMYGMGYSHANCGGVCVKQGQGDWIKTLINFPARFQEAEEWEREMRLNPTNSDYTILKRVVSGNVQTLTLEQLRKEYESGNRNGFSEFSCISCGVGDFSDENQ